MDQDTLSKTLQILKLYLEDKVLDVAAVSSIVTFLRFVAEQAPKKKLDLELFRQMDLELETFFSNSSMLSESTTEQVLLTSKQVFLKLHPDWKDRRSALREMFEKGERRSLRKILVENETSLFDSEDVESNEIFRLEGLNRSIFSALLEEARSLLEEPEMLEKPEIENRLKQVPVETENLKYISRLIGKLSNRLICSNNEVMTSELLLIFNNLASIIFESSNEILKAVEARLARIETRFEKDPEELKIRKQFLEVATKTYLGTILTTIIAVQSHQQQLGQASEVGMALINDLTIQCCRLATKFDDPETLSVQHQLELVSPWTSAIVVETPHPVKDGYKSSESIQVQGAKRLVLCLDHRSSTQNDYDKLVILSGLGKRVAEFGGNPYGQGNKRQLGTGWPSKPLVVDGNTVMLNFEMKSRREAETMDKAVWGYKAYVGAIYGTAPKSDLSIFAQVALSLIPILKTRLASAFEGSPMSPEETECKVLLESKLLQRCKWKSTSAPLDSSELSPLKFPWEVMKKLKSLTCCKLPFLRPSLKSLICPEILEEKILTVVIKHMGLSETVANLCHWEQDNSPEMFILSELVTEVYLKICSLVRRLQVLANLESQWRDEVERMREGDLEEARDIFFQDYLHHESKAKELALLCFLKGVKIDDTSQEQKILQELKDLIEKDARVSGFHPDKGTTTEVIVKGIFARLDLLLRVDVGSRCDNDEENLMTRSLQNWPDLSSGEFRGFRRQHSDIERSLDDSILQIPKLKSRLKNVKGRKIALDALKRELRQDKSDKLNLIDQLFNFIGYRPEEAVSTGSFLKAVAIRRNRCQQRIEALTFMRNLLDSTAGLSWSFAIPVAEILQKGLRTEELSCGDMFKETTLEFSSVVADLVRVVERRPKDCLSSIGHLCIIPYKRSEEKCLLQSQLVRLLDELCDGRDLKKLRRADDQGSEISKLAWLGFKVLAQRCIAWEEQEDAEEDPDESRALIFTQKPDTLSLENQVSNLLANYLVKSSRSGSVAIGNEVLQEVLVLLSGLSKSRLGRGILSEPPCVSKLLQLLTEPYLSPKVTMTIVKMANVALPIMTKEASLRLSVPPLSDDVIVETKIINLLLKKLSDYLIPESETFSKPVPEPVSSPDEVEDLPVDASHQQERSDTSNRLSLFVHKRKDQTGHEIIQMMLNSTLEMEIFSTNSQESMEKVVRVDKELNKTQKAELLTNDATVIYRVANR